MTIKLEPDQDASGPLLTKDPIMLGVPSQGLPNQVPALGCWARVAELPCFLWLYVISVATGLKFLEIQV